MTDRTTSNGPAGRSLETAGGPSPETATPETATPPPAAPTSEKVSRRRLATRARLMDAARTVFAARGVHGSSVEEICDAAGFTRGAFYSNYADKEELTRDLLRRERSRILDTVREESTSTDIDTAVEAVLAAQQPRVDYFVIQYELQLHALRSREFAPMVEESEAAFHAVVRGILDRELERLRLEPVTDLQTVTEAVTALTERSIRRATLAGDEDLLGLARTTLPHVLRGLTRPASADPAASRQDS